MLITVDTKLTGWREHIIVDAYDVAHGTGGNAVTLHYQVAGYLGIDRIEDAVVAGALSESSSDEALLSAMTMETQHRVVPIPRAVESKNNLLPGEPDTSRMAATFDELKAAAHSAFGAALQENKDTLCLIIRDTISHLKKREERMRAKETD